MLGLVLPLISVFYPAGPFKTLICKKIYIYIIP